MRGYFCIGFIGFVQKGKSFSEYITMLSPNYYKNNNKITVKYFQ